MLFRARVMLISKLMASFWIPSSIQILPPEMFGADDAQEFQRTDVRFLSVTVTPSASQSLYQVRPGAAARQPAATAAEHSGPTVGYRVDGRAADAQSFQCAKYRES